MKTPYHVACSLAGAVLVSIASALVLWTEQRAPFSGLILALPIGAVFGFIAGACFEGKENRGAIVFSALFGIGMGIEGGLQGYSASGLLMAISEFVNDAIAGSFGGAIYGRLAVAIVKWSRRKVGARIHGPASEAIFGCLTGGVATTALMATLVVLQAPSEPSMTQFVEALKGDIGGSLFGFVPMSIAGGIAGALAGAMTPRPEDGRVSD
jgi:hypothetical protein